MKMELRAPFAEDFAKYHLKGSEKNPLTDDELRSRKRLNSRLLLTTSTLGLTGLGSIMVAGAMRKNPKLFNIKNGNKFVRDKNTGTKYRVADRKAQKLKDKGYIIGSTAGGIGGINGINFAGIQREESRRRMAGAVKKNYNAYTGTDSRRYTPKVSRFHADPERSRQRRAIAYTPLAAAGGGAMIAGHKKIGELAESRGVEFKNIDASSNKQIKSYREAKKARKTLDRKSRMASRKYNPSKLKAADDLAHKKRVNGQWTAYHDYTSAKTNSQMSKDSIRRKKEKWQATPEYKKWQKHKARKIKAKNTSAAAKQGAKRFASLDKPTKPIKSMPKLRTGGKVAAIAGGTGLIGAGVYNEVQRHKSGRPYKSYFDQYKNK